MSLNSKGLGKKGEGRVDPVEIVILPNGAYIYICIIKILINISLGLSLDACIKLKETKKLRTVGEQPSKHRRRRKRKQQAKQKMESVKEPVSLSQLVVLNFNMLWPLKER